MKHTEEEILVKIPWKYQERCEYKHWSQREHNSLREGLLPLIIFHNLFRWRGSVDGRLRTAD